LEPQKIQIKKEYKAHEILAICLHFYNNGYYIHNVENYYPIEFEFYPIDHITNEKNPVFKTNPFEMTSGKYLFEFSNDRGDYHKLPTTKIMFKYDGNWVYFIFKFFEKTWNKYELNHVDIKSFTTKSYRLDIVEEKIKFGENLNRIARKLKFYDNSSPYIFDVINRSLVFRKPVFSLDYIYGFKNYFDSIKNYNNLANKTQEFISNLLDCVENDMQDGITYNFKILKFRKNNFNSFEISLNKSFNIIQFNNTLSEINNTNRFYNLDPVFNIIIPVFEQIGGIDELRNVILHNRILTE
jgi:hypothetical protein